MLHLRRAKPDTFYDILGCSPFSSQEEIAAAYKRSIMAVHPDKVSPLEVPPDEWDRRLAWTKEINRAWEALKDPESRRSYDQETGIDNHPGWRRRLGRMRAGLEEEQPNARLRSRLRRPELSVSRSAPKPPGALARLWDRLLSRRDGQWLLLILVALLSHAAIGAASSAPAISAPERGMLELSLVLAFAIWLAREGEPTPLFDALAFALAFNERLFRVVSASLRTASRASGQALASGIEQTVSAARAQHAADTADELDSYDLPPAAVRGAKPPTPKPPPRPRG